MQGAVDHRGKTMAHQDVTRTVKIEIDFFMQNNNAQNTLHAKATGPIALSDLDDLAGVIEGWLTTDWAPIAAAEWAAQNVTLTDLNSLAGPRKSYPISSPIVGGLTADPIPAGSTLAVQGNVGRRGKGIQGRVFWIGLANSQVDGNTVTSDQVTAIVDALNNLNSLVTAMAAFDGLCVPHLVVGGSRPNPATSDLIVTFLVTNNLIDSQKDRLPFHKKHKRFPVA